MIASVAEKSRWFVQKHRNILPVVSSHTCARLLKYDEKKKAAGRSEEKPQKREMKDEEVQILQFNSEVDGQPRDKSKEYGDE